MSYRAKYDCSILIAKMRTDIEEAYGIKVPDEQVLEDTDENFFYLDSKGRIVDWNKCTFTFWRNIDT